MEKQKTKRVRNGILLVLAGAALVLAIRSCSSNAARTTAETETTVSNASMESSVSGTETRPSLADSYCIENVPHILQTTAYPTGCESVAAVSLLQFYGADITVKDFIDSYLPKADYPYYDDNGIMHGESPWEYFIGDPYSKSGYGCYAPPIVEAMAAAAPPELHVEEVEAPSLQSLCERYVALGEPVLVWATMYMLPPEEGRAWLLPDGEEFVFIRPEHALLLIGYDEDYYYFSDSLSEETVTAYPKEASETAFAAMYSQAVVVRTEPNRTD